MTLPLDVDEKISGAMISWMWTKSGRCFICGSDRFWTNPGGQRLCAVCHPPVFGDSESPDRARSGSCSKPECHQKSKDDGDTVQLSFFTEDNEHD